MISETETRVALSISQLAERTGVPSATLRTWEARFGHPRPKRLRGGHRRYDNGDVALVEEILRQRASGLGVEAAIEQAVQKGTPNEPSVFASLRRRHPELVAQALRKSTLLALTRAIEDECCARAESPVLFASFQRERFYRSSRSRWQELSRTARATVVFADFQRQSTTGRYPLRLRPPKDAPLQREWLVVCDAPDYPACLTGWEFPGQTDIPDVERRFETMWSVDPSIVRDAARICVDLADTSAPGTGDALAAHLAGSPPKASPDLRRASGLLHRMVAYLEQG